MKRQILAVTAALMIALAPAAAQNYKIGTISIEVPWTRATPAGAKVAGGFMKITNTGRETDRLIGGTAIGAGRLEIHEMAMIDNVMKMRELAKGLEIKPGQSIELKPGSYHVMFMNLQTPMKTGERVKGTLVFEKAGTIELEYAVREMGARDGGSHGMKH